MTHDAMTHDTVRPANEVRILELEVQKLEFEKRIAQLKAEQTTDEECVGCAGPCNVVDVAAKLQEELDEAHGILASKDRVLVNLHKTINEYNETIRVERIDRAAEKEVVNRKFSEDLRKLNATIEGLKDSNIEDLKEQKRLELKLHHAKSDYEIMRTNHCNTVNKLKDDIEDLNSAIDGLAAERDDLKQMLSAASVVIEKLEAEVAARKGDSEVLMKVVEIVKNWDDSTGRAFPTLIKILDELVDYTDAPEGPPETPIDDLYRVSVFLEMP